VDQDSTQAWLAGQVGVSESLIQKIELGKKPLNEDVANMLLIRFGIDPTPLLAPKPKLISILEYGGSLPLKACLEQWCAQGRPNISEELNDDAVPLLESTGLAKLRILARSASIKGKGALFSYLLSEWIEKTSKDLELDFTRTVELQKLTPEERFLVSTPFFVKRKDRNQNVIGFAYQTSNGGAGGP
jgi:transcriptional regulator with XRE-family HTH domain